MSNYGERFNTAVAAELRAERARKQMSVADLATKSGVSKSAVARYLTGERDIPLPTLMDLCQALSVSPVLIFDRAQHGGHEG